MIPRLSVDSQHVHPPARTSEIHTAGRPETSRAAVKRPTPNHRLRRFTVPCPDPAREPAAATLAPPAPAPSRHPGRGAPPPLLPSTRPPPAREPAPRPPAATTRARAAAPAEPDDVDASRPNRPDAATSRPPPRPVEHGATTTWPASATRSTVSPSRTTTGSPRRPPHPHFNPYSTWDASQTAGTVPVPPRRTRILPLASFEPTAISQSRLTVRPGP